MKIKVIFQRLVLVLIALCTIGPSFRGKKILYALGILLWLALAAEGTFLQHILKGNGAKWILGMVPWVIMTVLVIVILPGLNSSSMYTSLLFSFISLIIVYKYIVDNDTGTLQFIARISLILYLVFLARAMIIAGNDSSIYRLNKASGIDNEKVGTFGIYYVAPLIMPIGFFYTVNYKGYRRIIGLIMCAITALLMVWAQYSIAFMLEFLIIAMYLCAGKSGRLRKISLLILLVLFFLFILNFDALVIKPLTTLMEDIPRTSPVKERLGDVIELFKGETKGDNMAVGRIERYLDSIRSFVKHPITGSLLLILFGFDVSGGKAGHNSMFELLNQYGIMAIPLYCFVYVFFKSAVRAWREIGHPYVRTIKIVGIAAVVLSCLNPIANLFGLVWMMFAFVPFAPLLFCTDEERTRFGEALKHQGTKL